MLLDRQSQLTVRLLSADFALDSVSMDELAQGANRALVGEEILQFRDAENLGDGLWRLTGLLRGRGGTEHLALAGTPGGAAFVLLDGETTALDAAQLGDADTVAAIGLGDEEPVLDSISGSGTTLRPLVPVHPRAETAADGSLALGWTRRARGAWSWAGTVDVPLVEQVESYEVGLGDPVAPLFAWTVSQPHLDIDAAQFAQLRADHSGQPLWVRQIGTHARSLPLLLTTL